MQNLKFNIFSGGMYVGKIYRTFPLSESLRGRADEAARPQEGGERGLSA